jgi:hypothetical protein
VKLVLSYKVQEFGTVWTVHEPIVADSVEVAIRQLRTGIERALELPFTDKFLEVGGKTFFLPNLVGDTDEPEQIIIQTLDDWHAANL